MLEGLTGAGFDVETRNHARAILEGDFPGALTGLTEALTGFRISARELIQSGGGHAETTMRLRDALYAANWRKHVFSVKTVVDGVARESVSHEVDHVLRTPAGVLALEIEWNNKDPFFDRDLENFQRLHALGAISLGVLVTRGASLQAALPGIVKGALEEAGIEAAEELADWGVKERTRRQTGKVEAARARGLGFAEAFAASFTADKFGPATTHWSKLIDRVHRGVGNPCPLLLIGLPVTAVAAEMPEAGEDWTLL